MKHFILYCKHCDDGTPEGMKACHGVLVSVDRDGRHKFTHQICGRTMSRVQSISPQASAREKSSWTKPREVPKLSIDECPECGGWIRGASGAQFFEGDIFQCDKGHYLRTHIREDGMAEMVMTENYSA